MLLSREMLDALLDQIVASDAQVEFGAAQISLLDVEVKQLRLAASFHEIAIGAASDRADLWKEQSDAHRSDARWSKFWQYIGLGIGGVGIAWGASAQSNGAPLR